jgi:hypothetical protein
LVFVVLVALGANQSEGNETCFARVITAAASEYSFPSFLTPRNLARLERLGRALELSFHPSMDVFRHHHRRVFGQGLYGELANCSSHSLNWTSLNPKSNLDLGCSLLS